MSCRGCWRCVKLTRFVASIAFRGCLTSRDQFHISTLQSKRISSALIDSGFRSGSHIMTPSALLLILSLDGVHRFNHPGNPPGIGVAATSTLTRMTSTMTRTTAMSTTSKTLVTTTLTTMSTTSTSPAKTKVGHTDLVLNDGDTLTHPGCDFLQDCVKVVTSCGMLPKNTGRLTVLGPNIEGKCIVASFSLAKDQHMVCSGKNLALDPAGDCLSSNHVYNKSEVKDLTDKLMTVHVTLLLCLVCVRCCFKGTPTGAESADPKDFNPWNWMQFFLFMWSSFWAGFLFNVGIQVATTGLNVGGAAITQLLTWVAAMVLEEVLFSAPLRCLHFSCKCCTFPLAFVTWWWGTLYFAMSTEFVWSAFGVAILGKYPLRDAFVQWLLDQGKTYFMDHDHVCDTKCKNKDETDKPDKPYDPLKSEDDSGDPEDPSYKRQHQGNQRNVTRVTTGVSQSDPEDSNAPQADPQSKPADLNSDVSPTGSKKKKKKGTVWCLVFAVSLRVFFPPKRRFFSLCASCLPAQGGKHQKRLYNQRALSRGHDETLMDCLQIQDSFFPFGTLLHCRRNEVHGIRRVCGERCQRNQFYSKLERLIWMTLILMVFGVFLRMACWSVQIDMQRHVAYHLFTNWNVSCWVPRSADSAGCWVQNKSTRNTQNV